MAISELAKTGLGRRTLRSLDNWLRHARGCELDDVNQWAALTVIKCAWEPDRGHAIEALRDGVAGLEADS